MCIRDRTAQDYQWEIVVADDGSIDHTTRLVGLKIAAYPNIRVLHLPHRGKGWAVKNGMLAAKGEYRVISDADLSVPIEQVDRLLPPLGPESDIVLGSRETPSASRIGEPSGRHFMGRAFNKLVGLLVMPGLADTQCGFKAFQTKVIQHIYEESRLYRNEATHLRGPSVTAFDVELLFRAYKSKYKIMEIPIDWYHEPQSKVNWFKDSIVMAMDGIKIRWYHATG